MKAEDVRSGILVAHLLDAAVAVSRSRTLASVAFRPNTTDELCTTATLNGLDILGDREQYRRKAMKTFLLVLLFTSAFVPIVIAQTSQAQEVTLTGTLQGGRIAIGGETTGWALEYRDNTGPHSIEVELPGALAARARSGAMVKLTGTIVTREYVERGSTRVLRVSRLEDGAAAAATPPAAAATPPAGAASRLPQLTIEQLNPQQRALADEILKVSSVGLGGPYNSMLRSPEMGAAHVQDAGLSSVQHVGAPPPERIRNPDPGASLDITGGMARALSARHQGRIVGSDRRRPQGRPAPGVDEAR